MSKETNRFLTKEELEKLSKEELVQQVLKADEEISTSEAIIQELKAELAKAADEILTASGVPTVKVGKDTYEVVIPTFRYKGNQYTALDVVKDDKLAAELVKRGSGVLLKKSK
ncbi:hypothetical protein GCM10027275_24980 [Rhabdobacter roseus]|uniref:Uncharacterized protein n=1 Tax=Rhabdobacter roseus TaxID=1655419 RepID=A0A840TW86_9BACT|nr:hypothetical protein [Rhabdobacter roseus]MBB5284438.1 hypothetical protein [Rhabdobacter roseus]